MPEKVIPILPELRPLPGARAPAVQGPVPLPLLDTLARPLTDLRISVTDRCNFRCRYCMPREVFDRSYRYMPYERIMRFEEIEQIVGLFVQLGVRKIRLTGGEPLLRKDVEHLVARLAPLHTMDGGTLDLSLTTNAALLKRKAPALKSAGLRRITVSLDALDDALFRRINDADFSLSEVLAGIEAADKAGLRPIKVNMVVQRGVNDHQILPMARHFRGTGVVLRFIEYMDVGSTNGWSEEQVFPAAQILSILKSEFTLEELAPGAPGETAQRFAFTAHRAGRDPSLGEIGLISSVTEPFCSACSRARLSTDGRIFLCLFEGRGWDALTPLRAGASDQVLKAQIAALWMGRNQRYSQLRAEHRQSSAPDPTPRIEMSYIGG